MPHPAPAALVMGGRCRPQRPLGSSSQKYRRTCALNSWPARSSCRGIHVGALQSLPPSATCRATHFVFPVSSSSRKGGSTRSATSLGDQQLPAGRSTCMRPTEQLRTRTHPLSTDGCIQFCPTHLCCTCRATPPRRPLGAAPPSGQARVQARRAHSAGQPRDPHCQALPLLTVPALLPSRGERRRPGPALQQAGSSSSSSGHGEGWRARGGI